MFPNLIKISFSSYLRSIMFHIMKKKEIRISNPEEFNEHLQHTSFFTWIVLGAAVSLLAGFFAWSLLYKMTIKIRGTATVSNNVATLVVDKSDLDKLQVGQKVYIEDKEGEILSFIDDQPVVSSFELSDGEYTYKVIIGEKVPFDFLLGK